jgi:hypothetical protein
MEHQKTACERFNRGIPAVAVPNERKLVFETIVVISLISTLLLFYQVKNVQEATRLQKLQSDLIAANAKALEERVKNQGL